MKVRSNAKLGVALLGALVVAVSLPMSVAAQAPAQAAEAEEEDSTQPVNDTWITTKVKADLMATSDVPGTEINVETVNGTVKLSGAVDSKAKADKAVAVAKKIKGVKSVDASALTVAKAHK